MPPQCPLETIRHTIQGGMLVIRRAPAFQADMGGVCDMLFQHLYQTRFAHPGFATEHDHLALAGFNLLPAFAEPPDFVLASDHWGEPTRPHDVQAAVGAAFLAVARF